jgi:general secretion pathway protein J
LIEVLVALAVFGVLSVMAYMGLGQTLSNADMLGERMQRLEAIQRAIRYLDSDLMQAAPRPVRDLLGDGYEPALRSSFASEYALEVTHGGWTNPAGLPRGTLQRSAYRIEDGELIRCREHRIPVPDRRRRSFGTMAAEQRTGAGRISAAATGRRNRTHAVG